MQECASLINGSAEDVPLEIAATSSAGSGELYYNLWALLDIDGVCQQQCICQCCCGDPEECMLMTVETSVLFSHLLSYCLCHIFERTNSDKSRGSPEVLGGTKLR